MSLNPMSQPVMQKIANMPINNPSTANRGLTEKPRFTMGHPRRMDADLFASTIAGLGLENATKSTNGVMKGQAADGSWFHLTPGVLKFKKGNGQPPSYPPNTPPATDVGGYPPAADVNGYAPPVFQYNY